MYIFDFDFFLNILELINIQPCIILVDKRKKGHSSYYLPDPRDENVTRGLECLRREGQLFWNNIRTESISHFAKVLDDSDRGLEFSDSDNDEGSSDDESIDSE